MVEWYIYIETNGRMVCRTLFSVFVCIIVLRVHTEGCKKVRPACVKLECFGKIHSFIEKNIWCNFDMEICFSFLFMWYGNLINLTFLFNTFISLKRNKNLHIYIYITFFTAFHVTSLWNFFPFGFNSCSHLEAQWRIFPSILLPYIAF